MDTILPKDVISKRQRRTMIKWVIAIAAIIAMTLLCLRLSQTSIDEREIYISQVKSGRIEASVGTFGKVVPSNEEIIISPIASKILQIYKNMGDKVNAGEPIMQLDMSQTLMNLEKAENELKMMQKKMVQAEAAAQQHISELEMKIEIDEMKLERAEAAFRNEQHLDSLGASTNDRIRQAELEHFVQKKELEHLRLQLANFIKTSAIDSEVATLEYEISKNNYDFLKLTADEARILAPYDAVITWIYSQTGANVMQGENLVVLSDLKNFKIEAEISDAYTEKINTGSPVQIMVGSDEVAGTVGNVIPSVSNGMLKFDVILDEANISQRLRPGQSLDLHVVTGIKDNCAYIDRRSFYKGPGNYELWIISGDRAKKRNVTLGEAGYERIEVVNGLEIGEQVILSNLDRFRNKKSLKIKSDRE